METLTALLKILASPGGEALLNSIFAAHQMTPQSVETLVAQMKPTPPLPPAEGA